MTDFTPKWWLFVEKILYPTGNESISHHGEVRRLIDPKCLSKRICWFPGKYFREIWVGEIIFHLSFHAWLILYFPGATSELCLFSKLVLGGALISGRMLSCTLLRFQWFGGWGLGGVGGDDNVPCTCTHLDATELMGSFALAHILMLRNWCFSLHLHTSLMGSVEATARWTRQWPGKPCPKYWQAHLWVVGVKMRAASETLRSGKAVLKVLPFKLVPPGASPPQESSVEVNNSGIMNQIRTSRNVRLYSDGARCWPAMCKARGIRNFHVKHNKFEFAKKLPDVKRPKRGVVAGTQCIDRMWASLDKFIPPELSNKSGKGGTVNEKIFTYLYAWVWRYHLPKKQTSKWNWPKFADKVRCRPCQKRGRQELMSKHHSSEVNQTQTEPKNQRAFTNAWPCFGPTCEIDNCRTTRRFTD